MALWEHKTFSKIVLYYCSLLCVLYYALNTGVPSAHGADHDLQSWAQIIAQGPNRHKLRGYMEFQPRFGSDLKRLERTLLRPAVWYAITPEWSIWLGYAWTPLFSPHFLNEQRTWQQILWNKQLAPFALQSRTRLEQRYIEGAPQTIHRLRQLIRANIPGHSSAPVWLVAWDELFLNFNSSGSLSKAGYDQNRAFLGVNVRLDEAFRFEAGYLNAHVKRVNKDDFFIHSILTALIMNF